MLEIVDQLSTLPPAELHEEVRASYQRSSQGHWEMAASLLAVQRSLAFRSLNCASVYEYADRFFGVSGGLVYNLLRVARALAELPLLSQALQNGQVSWCKIREITRVATAADDADWVRFATQNDTRAVEQRVARRPGGKHDPKRGRNGTARPQPAEPTTPQNPSPSPQNEAQTPGGAKDARAETQAARHAETQAAEAETQAAQAESQVAEQQTQAAHAESQVAEQQTQAAHAESHVAEQQTQPAQAESHVAEQPTKATHAESQVAKEQTLAEQPETQAAHEGAADSKPMPSGGGTCSQAGSPGATRSEEEQPLLPWLDVDSEHSEATAGREASSSRIDGSEQAGTDGPASPTRDDDGLPEPRVRLTFTLTREEYAIYERARERVMRRLKTRMSAEQVLTEMASAVLAAGSSRSRARYPVIVEGADEGVAGDGTEQTSGVVHVDNTTLASPRRGDDAERADEGVAGEGTEQMSGIVHVDNIASASPDRGDAGERADGGCGAKASVPRTRRRVSRARRRSLSVATVRLILDRAGHRCQRCRRRGFLEVDHVEPIAAGGSDAPDNLRALCRACHSLRHYQDRKRATRTSGAAGRARAG